MKRTIALIAAGALAASVAVPLAAAKPPRAKLLLRKTRYGKILATARGYTLYAYTKDGRNKDKCARTPGCLSLWPALTTSGKPIAGPGVRASLIGTITLRPGVKQVTYAGHPLYTYIGDSGPGQTYYVGIYQSGGYWPAVNAAGREVMKK